MIDNIDDKFSVFLPFEVIEKAGEGDKKEMKIRGVASTTKADSDDEILEPDGFDVSKFLKSGFLNYNHLASKDPSMIIGEPTKAVAKNGELHIEGVLYPDSVMANKVYETAKVLKKSSKTRAFGFSIEGKALERDPLNPKRITKASITGCAITPSPKNPGTKLEIVKGGIDAFNFETEEGSEFLVDVTDEFGVRTTVDKNFVIEKSHTKAEQEIEETDDDSEVEKGMEANGQVQEASTAAEMDGVTAKESLEGAKKKKKKTEQDKKTFSKAETYEEIFSMFNCNVEDAPHLYKLIEGIQYVLTPNMEKTQISKEAIQKAQEILGLVSAPTTPAPSAEDEAKKAEEIKKAEIQAQLAETLKKADELKALLGESAAAPVKVEDPKVETAKVEAPLVKAEVAEDKIMKAMDEKFQAIGTLIASKDEEIGLIKGENEELKKGINEITEFNKRLAAKIGMIEQQPLDRKSVTTTKFIEKGEGDGPVSGGSQMTTLSLSNKTHRAALADALYKGATKDPNKLDSELVKAVQTVELGSLGDTPQFSARLQKRLAEEFKINVVK